MVEGAGVIVCPGSVGNCGVLESCLNLTVEKLKTVRNIVCINDF